MIDRGSVNIVRTVKTGAVQAAGLHGDLDVSLYYPIIGAPSLLGSYLIVNCEAILYD